MDISKLFFLLFLIKSSISTKVVCYYSAWAVYTKNGHDVQPEDLDYNICTHINYAFVDLQADGGLKPDDRYADIVKKGYQRTTGLKEKNPELKVILSIGPSSNYRQVANDSDKRANLINNTRTLIETYNFDGVDIDWETPAKQDKANFLALLEEFRNDFDRNGWIISAAVSAIPSTGYDIPKMSTLLDHINLMTYDMYGPKWSRYTGQNSPLYASSIESNWERNYLNLASSVQNWLKLGVDPKKLCVGLAFYGRTYTLNDPKVDGLHAPFISAGKPGPVLNAAGVMSYLDICLSDWKCRWDDEQKNPICTNNDQWLGSDNPASIREKVGYIKGQQLGGVMIWTINYDDVHGACGEAKPLLIAVRDALNK